LPPAIDQGGGKWREDILDFSGEGFRATFYAMGTTPHGSNAQVLPEADPWEAKLV
jgi:hypothetical protein